MKKLAVAACLAAVASILLPGAARAADPVRPMAGIGTEESATSPSFDITATQATLGGWAWGGWTDATAQFRYGPTTAYGTVTPPRVVPSTSVNGRYFIETITGLLPATTYHFQLVATNSVGTSQSDDFTFTTEPAEPAPTTKKVTPSAPAAMSVTYNVGAVRCDGQPHTYGTLHGARTGERVTFRSRTFKHLISARATPVGTVTLHLACSPTRTPAVRGWITATGASSHRTVTYTLVGQAPQLRTATTHG